MRVEYTELSLQGERDTNEDRVTVAALQDCALLSACDGMGGHADGERAAETAQRTIMERFRKAPPPLFDPLGFLSLSLAAAHERVVGLGAHLPVELRPRATCALCVVQDWSAYWGHVGDSRIYHVRAGNVLARTRDHSHVELLLREGVINDGQVPGHPMRNFVESCLGGDALLPEMGISARRALLPHDVLLVCTDGFWVGLDDARIGSAFVTHEAPLHDTLAALAAQAHEQAGGTSDNISVAAVRLHG